MSPDCHATASNVSLIKDVISEEAKKPNPVKRIDQFYNISSVTV